MKMMKSTTTTETGLGMDGRSHRPVRDEQRAAPILASVVPIRRLRSASMREAQ